MSKFNIGNKVRIVDCNYGSLELKDEIATIKGIKTFKEIITNNDFIMYTIDTDEGRYFWNESCFELVDSRDEINSLKEEIIELKEKIRRFENKDKLTMLAKNIEDKIWMCTDGGKNCSDECEFKKTVKENKLTDCRTLLVVNELDRMNKLKL